MYVVIMVSYGGGDTGIPSAPQEFLKVDESLTQYLLVPVANF